MTRAHADYRRWLESEGAKLPPSKALDPAGASSLYATGKAPSGSYPTPESLTWQRVHGSDGAGARLWVQGASSTDPKQGQLGDCWLISAMSLIATRDGEWEGCAWLTALANPHAGSGQADL